MWEKTLERNSHIVIIGVLAVMAFFGAGLAANIDTGSGGNAGQGVNVTDGYTAGVVSFSGGWVNGENNTNTNVNSFNFILKKNSDGAGASSVTNGNTVVYAQLLTNSGNANWTQCYVSPAAPAGTVVCALTGGQQRTLAEVTGVSVVAADNTDDDAFVPASFSPMELNPVVWLDASDETTITSSENLVSQWNDKSGNGLNVTQSSSGAKPSTGVAALNGKNVIDFTPNDVLASTGEINLTGGATIYVVASNDVNRSWNGLLRVAPTLNQSSSFLELYWQSSGTTSNSGNLGVVANRGGVNRSIFIGSTGPPAGEWYLAGTTFSAAAPTTAQLFIQATQGGAYNGSGVFTSPSAAPFWVGVGYYAGFLDGKIAEMIVVPAAVSTEQRQRLEGYLAQKWGLVDYLPEGHPYK